MKRYDLAHVSSGTDAFDEYDDLREKPHGTWVKFKEVDELIVAKEAEIARLCQLLMRGSNQLENWHKWYGSLGTPSLPPHGDVRFLEDAGEALVKFGVGL